MKVKYLLTFAFFAMGTMAFAQKDITSDYIQNADLVTNTDGWTSVAFNNPQKQANSGTAIEAYAGWGSLEKTAYSLTQKVTLPAGSYRLEGSAFFRQGVAYNTNSTKSLAFLKAGDKSVALKTLGSETAKAYANTQKEAAGVLSAGMYVNTVDFELEEEKEIEIGYYGTFDEKQSWCLVAGPRLYDMNQDPTNYDYTSKIVNPSFENGTAGWTVEGQWGEQNNGEAVKLGTRYVEKWQASGGLPNGKVSQVVSGLPNGKYIVTAVANQTGENTFVIANEAMVQAPKGAALVTLNTDVTDGTLTLAFSRESTTSNWVAIDNFRIYCAELNIDDLKNAHAATVTKAEALYDDQDITAEEAAALKTVVDENALTETDGSRVVLAKQAKIEEAIKVAEAQIAANKAEKEYKEAQKARTVTALANGAIATDVIDGWRCTNQQDFHVNTWSTEGNTDGSNMTTPFIQNWIVNGNKLADGTVTFLLNGLKPGDKYVFSALARAYVERQQNVNLTGVTMFANEASVDLTEEGTAINSTVSSGVYGTFTLEGTVDENGEFLVGFKLDNTNCNWLSFKNVKFGLKASEEDIAAYNTAVEAVPALGFEKDEAAPYLNVAALNTLEENTIDVENTTKKEITEATAVLKALEWTLNTEDVNAIEPLAVYNDESAKDADHHVIANGWSTDGGSDSYNTRIQLASNTPEGIGNVLFAKFTTSYGQEQGYTLPLKAGYYALKFKAAGWGGENGARTVTMTSGENTIVPVTPVDNKVTVKNNRGDESANDWVEYDLVFNVEEAGNYVLNFVKTTNSQNQIVFADIELVKATAADIELIGTTVNDIATKELVVTTNYPVAIAGEEIKAYVRLIGTKDVYKDVTVKADDDNITFTCSFDEIKDEGQYELVFPANYFTFLEEVYAQDVIVAFEAGRFSKFTAVIEDPVVEVKDGKAVKDETLTIDFGTPTITVAGTTRNVVIFGSSYLSNLGANIKEVSGLVVADGKIVEDKTISSDVTAVNSFELNIPLENVKGQTFDVILPAGFFIYLDENYDWTGAQEQEAVDARIKRAAAQGLVGEVQEIRVNLQVVEGVVTGINSVKAVANDGKVFDLSGKMVSDPVKGNVYVIDGKKILF